MGVRSIAAPVRDVRGNVLAALNVSTHAGRVTVQEMERDFLPHLLRVATLVGERVTTR
jgi:IclR family pca regulon transcriptional regulator